MFKTIRVLLIATFIVLGIASCSSPFEETTPLPPVSTLTNTPLSPTITPVQPTATATRIPLPVVRGNVESVYCQLPSIPLSLADAQGFE